PDIAFALAATPRLSYRTDAMPFSARAWPSSLYESVSSVLPGDTGTGELPSRSVGPDPAIISTTGCRAVPGRTTREPAISPVGVSRVIGTEGMLSCWEGIGARDNAETSSAVSMGAWSEISYLAY